MRYAITGATGFVGGALTRLLLAEGHDVTALVRRPDQAHGLAASGVVLHAGDVTDAQSIGPALEGADGLFHVAGWFKVGIRAAAEGWRINVDGTRNVLAAARVTGTPRVVYTSTLAVNGDTGGRTVDERYHYTGAHLTTYDASKAAAHAVVRAAVDLPVVTVMPGGVYGPGDTSQIGALTAAVVAGRRIVVARGPTMCQAHVDDIARGHLLAMLRGKPGEAYMLAGPQVGLGEFLDLVADIAGTRHPLRVPTRLPARLAGPMARVGRIVPLPPTYSAESLRVASASYLGTSAKAAAELGWSPRALREGVAETVAALRAAG